MAAWKKVVLSVFLIAAVAAGACAVAGFNPFELLACDPSDPMCNGG